MGARSAGSRRRRGCRSREEERGHPRHLRRKGSSHDRADTGGPSTATSAHLGARGSCVAHPRGLPADTAFGGTAMLSALAPARGRGGAQRRRHPELRSALRAPAGDLLHAGRGARHDRHHDGGEAGMGAHARRPRACAREDPQAGPRSQGRGRRPSTSETRTRQMRRSPAPPWPWKTSRWRCSAGVTAEDPEPRPDRAASLGLLTVEARHAAWARNIVARDSRRPRVRQAVIAGSGAP